MAEELPFDEPFAFVGPAGMAAWDALADHLTELAQLERRAEEATSLGELAELQTAYQDLKRDALQTWSRWLVSQRDLNSWYRKRRRPCSKGCGRGVTPGRRKCDACRKAEERSRREQRWHVELLRRDELDRLPVALAELDSLMQLDLARPEQAHRDLRRAAR